ncbi:MAG TPA: ABC transporter permease [Vicinamibacterales bacterium]|nr:ABC transporter permease [Vicinamibacterales bacterium]
MPALWIGVIADTLSNAMKVHLDILRQDVRHTGRALRRAPGFFLAAVIVTALGIGATTAAFTLTDHVLLRPLPFPQPDRLVKIWEGDAVRDPSLRGLQGTNDVSPANYRDWKALSTSFAAMGAYWGVAANLVGTGDPERLPGVDLTSDVIRTLGIAPALGRILTDTDDKPGAPCVVLVSDSFWRRKLGASVSILSKRRAPTNARRCARPGLLVDLDFDASGDFRGQIIQPSRDQHHHRAEDAVEDRHHHDRARAKEHAHERAARLVLAHRRGAAEQHHDHRDTGADDEPDARIQHAADFRRRDGTDSLDLHGRSSGVGDVTRRHYHWRRSSAAIVWPLPHQLSAPIAERRSPARTARSAVRRHRVWISVWAGSFTRPRTN